MGWIHSFMSFIPQILPNHGPGGEIDKSKGNVLVVVTGNDQVLKSPPPSG